MKKSILINTISWLCVTIGLFAYLEQTCAFNYFYAEQFRLFRFSSDYVAQLFSHPGGAMEYLASFLMQFFIYPYVGPLTAALLFAGIGIGIQGLWRKCSPQFSLPILYLVPGILLLFADMDFNYHLEGTLAFALTVGVLNIYIRLSSLRMRLLFMRIATWALYFLVGPAAVIAALCAVIYECLLSSHFKWYSLLLLVWVFIPIAWWYSGGQGGEARIVFLPDAYFNPRLPSQTLHYYIWSSLPLIFLIARLTRYFHEPPFKWWKYISPSLQLLLAVWLLHAGSQKYNVSKNYQVKILDYYCHTGQWQQLLEQPLRSAQNSMHACYQNLALAQLGVLGNKLFSFPQCGANGLWISWNRSASVASLLSDVNYAIGNVAVAQELAFEGMIASERAVNPRFLIRLIETNLIYGHRKVAEKYIYLLEQTHAYARQATSYRKFLKDDRTVDTDPILGAKRRCIAHTDGLSQGKGDPNDLLKIIRSNPESKTTFEYLGAFALLNKEVAPFVQLMEEYHTKKGLQPMPVHFQEAAILAHETDTTAWSKCGVTPQVADRFSAYKQTVLANKGSYALADKLRMNFGNTYWYYFMFTK